MRRTKSWIELPTSCGVTNNDVDVRYKKDDMTEQKWVSNLPVYTMIHFSTMGDPKLCVLPWYDHISDGIIIQ